MLKDIVPEHDGQVIAKITRAESGISEDTIRRDLRELAQEAKRRLAIHRGTIGCQSSAGASSK
jgi:DeoR/GlpR family transcriptional regulator of sugar metabolism